MIGDIQCLTVWQPWASLLALGAKQYETRGWPTRYRGPVAIHASIQWRREDAILCLQEPFRFALEAAGVELDAEALSWKTRRPPRVLPLGVVLAVGELVDCIETWPPPADVPGYELAFGDWGPARFAWRIANVVRLAEPVPSKGQQGLYPLPRAARPAVEDQLGRTAARES